MDHPYSAWADVLSKFQGSPLSIQALWLVLTAVVALGVVWCVTDIVKHLVCAFRRREPPPRVIHGVVQDGDGRWLLYENGIVTGVAERRENAALVDLLQGHEGARLPPQQRGTGDTKEAD